MLMMRMAFQYSGSSVRMRLMRCRSGYEKLVSGENDDEKLGLGSGSGSRPRRRRCHHWVKRMNGGVMRVRGLRLSRSRKLTLRALTSAMMLSSCSRIGRVYEDIMSRMKRQLLYADLCPNIPSIIFSTQWGLPVLSHPSSSFSSAKCSRRSKNVAGTSTSSAASISVNRDLPCF